MASMTAVIFDLGDTLVDLGEGRGDYEARVRGRAGRVYDVLAAAGVAPADRPAFCHAVAAGSEARYQAAIAEQRGVNAEQVLGVLCAEMGIALDAGLLAACGDAYCRSEGLPTPLRVGALPMLDQLRAAGYRLGVISNTIQPGRTMDVSLARRGILDYFGVRVYSSDLGIAKPHPAIFRAALAALDVSPERAVYVGDRLVHDIAGAQAVGMFAVLIEVAHRVEQHSAITPDARIAELAELPSVLARLALKSPPHA